MSWIEKYINIIPPICYINIFYQSSTMQTWHFCERLRPSAALGAKKNISFSIPYWLTVFLILPLLSWTIIVCFVIIISWIEIIKRASNLWFYFSFILFITFNPLMSSYHLHFIYHWRPFYIFLYHLKSHRCRRHFNLVTSSRLIVLSEFRHWVLFLISCTTYAWARVESSNLLDPLIFQKQVSYM